MSRTRIVHNQQFIEDRVSMEPTSGCCLWLGMLTTDGYGAWKKRDRTYERAHRGAYRIFRGAIG